MYCVKCLYNLVNLDKNRCPECGQVFDPADSLTYLDQSQQVGLPLFSKLWSFRFIMWCAGHRAFAWLIYFILQFGIRAAGSTFITMMILISVIEGESGMRRSNWVNIAVTAAVILIGFYVTHAILPLIRRAGIPDLIKYWSYVLGIGLAAIQFASPLRP